MKYAVIDVGSEHGALVRLRRVVSREAQVQNHHEPQNHGGFGGLYRRWGVFLNSKV